MMTQANGLYDALEAGLPPAADAGLFGVDVPKEAASLVVLPVPWDVTASYQRGAAAAPEAVRVASHQLDLEDFDFGPVYRAGILLDQPIAIPDCDVGSVAAVNDASTQVNQAVYGWAQQALAAGKIPAVIGGDHSAPLGLLEALGAHFRAFGILHIDAHHDLRVAYEGYTYSHASIMYNALESVDAIKRLVSVGIRDFSKSERAYAEASQGRVATYYDRQVVMRKQAGESFATIADEILAALPEHVYVSFDIDGLDPALCPGTGTPVPGGLSYAEAESLLVKLGQTNKKIIGFDLCEVGPRAHDGEWNANVGARILYKLCGACVASRGMLT